MTIVEESTLVSEARTRESCMSQLKAMVLESTELRKLIDSEEDWFRAVVVALSLFEQPRNIEQLWVWSRFVWVFGRRDTWKANETLEAVLHLHSRGITWHRKLVDLQNELDNRSWFQFASRARLGAAIEEAEEVLEVINRKLEEQFDTLLVNDNTWSDRSDFLAFKGRH